MTTTEETMRAALEKIAALQTEMPTTEVAPAGGFLTGFLTGFEVGEEHGIKIGYHDAAEIARAALAVKP